MATFSANVLQWVIYDSYQEDFAAQLLEKELEREKREKEKAPVSKQPTSSKKIVGRTQLSEAVQGRVFECWKVLERMINLNTYDDIAKGKFCMNKISLYFTKTYKNVLVFLLRYSAAQ